MPPSPPPLPRFAAALASALLLGVASAARAAPDAGVPADGRALLERMRLAYDGRWYRTLTFLQETEVHGADGGVRVELWTERLRHADAGGTVLRIDQGVPATGTGVLYTPTETRRFREGADAGVTSGGNALLPLVEGIYVQPVARTLAELAPTGVDFARPLLRGTWEGRPVWIAGAHAAGDVRSPQLWVDVERLVVVRAVLAAVPEAPTMDVRFSEWVRLGRAWLATRCDFLVDGTLVQSERYRDWRADVPLADAFFDPDRFGAAARMPDAAHPDAGPRSR